MAEITATLDDFRDDPPYAARAGAAEPAPLAAPGAVAGVVLQPLVPRADGRGRLVVLMSRPGDAGPEEPMVHAYRVHAEAGSIRAWVFHRLQSDRLSFTEGRFRIVLIDLRPDSPTHGVTQVVDAGEDAPLRVTIPPLVVHGVRNVGDAMASFVNLPTRAFDLARPDKARLPYGHPGISYRFD